MSRLSIVIPALRPVELLENSLVSVLQNRPADTEVLIVHTEPYNDPHGLEGEIRFIAASQDSSFVETANLGFAACRAPVVHLLGCGAEVTDGWTDEPLRHFDDPTVAAVASLVLDLNEPKRTLSAGVAYGRGGRAKNRAAGRLAAKAAKSAPRVLGPSRLAAFYRKSVLDQLGGFEPAVGDGLADVDFALQVRSLGLQCRFEPQSLVYVEQPAPVVPGFATARAAERLFRRHAGQIGWPSSLAIHPFTVANDVIRSIPRISAISGCLGRLTAWLEGPQKRGLGRTKDNRHNETVTGRQGGARLDNAHVRRRRDAEKHGSWVPAQE